MAITEEQAVAVAQAYVDANPIPNRKYRRTVKRWRPDAEGWYFAFTYERVDGQPLFKRDALFGASGFIVSSVDGTVRPVSHRVVGRMEWSQCEIGAG